MGRFSHLLGMRKSEAIDEIARILKSLGFTVRTGDFIIEGSKDSELVRVEFREGERGTLGIPTTEVVFYCEKRTHDNIARRIMFLRGGG
jgi:hypothetical protein